MNKLQKLGMMGVAAHPQALVMPTTSAPTRRVNFQQAPKVRPSEHPDPAKALRAAGLITELSTGMVMVDHAARALRALGLFKREANRDLGLLKAQADKLLTAMQSHFEMDDSDGANALADVLGLLGEKACQLKPSQLEALLKHADNMRESNLDYIPATTR